MAFYLLFYSTLLHFHSIVAPLLFNSCYFSPQVQRSRISTEIDLSSIDLSSIDLSEIETSAPKTKTKSVKDASDSDEAADELPTDDDDDVRNEMTLLTDLK